MLSTKRIYLAAVSKGINEKKRKFVVKGEELQLNKFLGLIKQSSLIINLSMLTQNKNISLRTAQSTPSSRYYRSVKYKINTSSVIDSMDPRHLTPAKANKTTIAWRKPSGYTQMPSRPSLNKNIMDESLARADINSKQRDSRDSTLRKDRENPEYSSTKVTYLQTWDSLLNPNFNANNLDKLKLLEEEVPSQYRQEKIKALRVMLPQIIDYDPSMFCSLDPLALPIEHIQRGIIELNKQLPQPKLQMNQIRSQMRSFKAKILNDLEQTKQQGAAGFEKLWGMLRGDRVIFQQGIMKLKRNCKDLLEIDEQFKANFQTTKPRVGILQDQIFSNRPFELQRNAEYEEQFPQIYF